MQAGDVPLLRIGVLRDVLGDEIVDHVVAHVGDGLGDMLVLHEVDALLEDDLALVVHDVVVLQDVLADVEVARLDLLLRLLERLVDPGMDDRLVLLQAELRQHAVQLSEPKMRIRSSCSDRKNFERPGSPWRPERPRSWLSMRRLSWRSVPSTKRPPAASAVSFSRATCGADRVGARVAHALGPVLDVGEFLADAHVGVAAELDVGAAAGHVGGDGDRARHAGLRDDVGLLLVVAGVQHREDLGRLGARVAGVERREGVRVGEVVLLPALLAQQLGELLGLLDRGGADQHRLAALLHSSISVMIAVYFSAAVR